MKKIALLLIITMLFSCQGSEEETVIQEFFVASQKQLCDGYIQNQQCLLIKINESEQAWSFFYESIIGFDHEDGFEYKIKVLREYIPENIHISDDSIYEYTLLEVLSKEEKDSEGI